MLLIGTMCAAAAYGAGFGVERALELLNVAEGEGAGASAEQDVSDGAATARMM